MLDLFHKSPRIIKFNPILLLLFIFSHLLHVSLLALEGLHVYKDSRFLGKNAQLIISMRLT